MHLGPLLTSFERTGIMMAPRQVSDAGQDSEGEHEVELLLNCRLGAERPSVALRRTQARTPRSTTGPPGTWLDRSLSIPYHACLIPGLRAAGPAAAATRQRVGHGPSLSLAA